MLFSYLPDREICIMKEKDQIKHTLKLGTLIGRKALGQELSTEEKSLLEQWVNDDEANRKLVEKIYNEDFRERELVQMNQIDIANGWQRLSKNRKVRILPFNRRTILYSVAASVTILITLAIGYQLLQPDLSNTRRLSQTDLAGAYIEPATSKATLSIASAKPIPLGDTTLFTESGKLTGKNGALILDRPGTSEGVATKLIVQTPKGGTYFVRLSDGTKIWLNADSKLSFPDRFSASERQISISGEAYMEVAADAGSPFTVHTSKGAIHVLGTAFNIRSYPGQQYEQATLLSGKIAVQAADKYKIIRPAEMASTGNGTIEVSVVNPENSLAWKSSIFLFRNAPVTEVLEEIGRWYNLDIVYDPSFAEKTAGFTARINRNERLDKVLAVLESSALATFKIQGRNLIILPGKIRAAENQP
ncbi:FecR family protein [Chitinophaga sp. RCC_12]|uniref:FecR family protein n=1 Tax=Chitinophaga sp. RCC_12 TaxID=3239226 RepID=UPI003525DBDA